MLDFIGTWDGSTTSSVELSAALYHLAGKTLMFMDKSVYIRIIGVAIAFTWLLNIDIELTKAHSELAILIAKKLGAACLTEVDTLAKYAFHFEELKLTLSPRVQAIWDRGDEHLSAEHHKAILTICDKYEGAQQYDYELFTAYLE